MVNGFLNRRGNLDEHIVYLGTFFAVPVCRWCRDLDRPLDTPLGRIKWRGETNAGQVGARARCRDLVKLS